MKIKEFFKDCIHCNYVWIFVCHIDKSGKPQFKSRKLYNPLDLMLFINDYGDEEILWWSVNGREEYTKITFYLKG